MNMNVIWPSLVSILLSASQSINAYLHAILQLCYYRTFREEVEHLSFESERHGDDERYEERHLCYEQDEDL